MTRILFINVTGSTNKGDMAYVIGHINCIKQRLPDAEIDIFSVDTNIDKVFTDYGAAVMANPWYRKTNSQFLSGSIAVLRVSRDVVGRFLHDIVRLFNNKSRHFYDKYDLVVDPHADGLNEPYYGFWETFYFLLNMLLARLIIRKPIIIGPTSIGPLTSKINKYLTRYLLNRIEIITIREKASEQYIRQELQINHSRLYLVDDLAFTIKPDYSEKVEDLLKKSHHANENKTIVGITVNHGMVNWNRPPEYIRLISSIAVYVINKLDATVLLIPQHDIITSKKTARSDSDVCQKIIAKIYRNQDCILVPNDITVEEWKAIIGSSDLHIGCRLHCCIMSTSLCIPTVTVSYGRKVNALIGQLMGQERGIATILDLPFDQALQNLQCTIDDIWKNRETIKKELEKRNQEVQQRIVNYALLIKQLINT